MKLKQCILLFVFQLNALWMNVKLLHSDSFTAELQFGFVHRMIKSDQVVESDALLPAAHEFKEAVICNQ